MLASIKKFIETESLFNKGDKLLLALSGGKDSMALCNFLKKENYLFEVAHCNFQLREKESNEDAKFLENFCLANELVFHLRIFETKEEAAKRGLSIQECARELRYAWFENLRQEINAQYILSAHHLDDNIETLIFKLLKGTGIKGVRGILPKQGHLIRPLLNTSRAEIEAYLVANNIPFREDSSNASTKYSRNKIRQDLIPVLRELNPGFSASFVDHFERWRDLELMHEEVAKSWESKLLEEREGEFFVSIAKLKNYTFLPSLIHLLFAKYGFNSSSLKDLKEALDSSESKQFFSEDYRILKDRKHLVLSLRSSLDTSRVYLIEEQKKSCRFAKGQVLKLHRKPIEKAGDWQVNKYTVLLDIDKLDFPLILRKWEAGDYFYPLGLQKASGKIAKKKLSKLLKDEKLSTHDKENTWILSSGNKVVWVIGYRMDERFKLTQNTKEVLQIKLV